MELEGHPTHDLVEELTRRGATATPGSRIGPDEPLRDRSSERGLWLFVPRTAYETEIDEVPNI